MTRDTDSASQRQTHYDGWYQAVTGGPLKGGRR